MTHRPYPPKSRNSGIFSDRYGRRIRYLRVSVTDRCNLRCSYCMPSPRLFLRPKEDMLSIEELYRLTKILIPCGITKIRITGGEPLLRRGIVDLVAAVKKIAPAVELSMTTNGVLLADFLDTLREAGLDRANVSLDTLRPKKFKALTGSDQLGKVLSGIGKLVAFEMFPVKVNVLLLPGFNQDEIGDFIEFARTMPIEVRFIEKMPIAQHSDISYLSVANVEEALFKKFGETKGSQKGGETARVLAMRGFKGKIGLISPMSRSFCGDCNRLRITADGKVITCLLGGSEVGVKNLLRRGASDEEIRTIVRNVLLEKPSDHTYQRLTGEGYPERCMANIGG